MFDRFDVLIHGAIGEIERNLVLPVQRKHLVENFRFYESGRYRFVEFVKVWILAQYERI
jgi:hypothetical protein